ncbi:MAG TPA: hypothetical protein VJG83_02610 [archaeon]|nr:hypothetical protein [archaeon]
MSERLCTRLQKPFSFSFKEKEKPLRKRKRKGLWQTLFLFPQGFSFSLEKEKGCVAGSGLGGFDSLSQLGISSAKLSPLR